MVLDESRSVAIIGTNNSRNPKTGPMKQIWILPKNKHPLEAIKDGTDKVVCGDCQLRPTLFNACYVTPMALGQIYKKYTRGEYPPVDALEWARGKVRFGAYGDPAFIPKKTLYQCFVHAERVGYTRQWRHRPDLQGLLMASVFSLEEKEEANNLNFCTFRIMQAHENPTPDELICPADGIIQCTSCGVCDGATKNVAIYVHGAETKMVNFDVLRKELSNPSTRNAKA